MGGYFCTDTSKVLPQAVEDQSSEPICEELIRQVNNNLSDEDIEQWLSEDVNYPGYQLLSNKEIVQQVRNEVAPAEDDESDEDPDEPNIPSNGEAAEVLDKCMSTNKKAHHLLYSCLRELGI